MKRPRKTHPYRADPIVRFRCRCGLPKKNAIHRVPAATEEEVDHARLLDARRLGEKD